MIPRPNDLMKGQLAMLLKKNPLMKCLFRPEPRPPVLKMDTLDDFRTRQSAGTTKTPTTPGFEYLLAVRHEPAPGGVCHRWTQMKHR
jgi:hypothetical protein